MSSAIKTLQLMSYFTQARPEIGLSELCRLAGRDKATTHRHLQALEQAGFVERNAATRRYRLGPALLQLAQTREATVPRKSAALDVLRALSDATGETVHVSVLSGQTLFALASCDSPAHSTRVVIDIQTFPLHATASGLCALAFGPEALLSATRIDLTPFTAQTATTPEALDAAVAQVRRSGFSRAAGTFESDTYSIAAPIYDQSGLFAGAVSVACVATRMTPDLDRTITTRLKIASRDITRNWGGTLPPHLEQLWASPRSPLGTLEPAT